MAWMGRVILIEPIGVPELGFVAVYDVANAYYMTVPEDPEKKIFDWVGMLLFVGPKSNVKIKDDVVIIPGRKIECVKVCYGIEELEEYFLRQEFYALNSYADGW